MTLRITQLSHLAHCSPVIRAQLEKHLDAIQATEQAGNVQTMQVARDPGKAKKIERPEQDAGKMLVEWVDLLVLPNGLKPGEFFAHIPNGGARSGIEAGILKGQGVRKGWPDYVLALPRGRYHGLYGELKALDGKKPDAEQLAVLHRLETVGYKVCVWFGFEEARNGICEYLDIRR